MSVACTHLNSIAVTELPETIVGCEDSSWCYLDEVAFLVTTSGGERG